MEKLSFDKGKELRSYAVNELSENGIIPRLIIWTTRNRLHEEPDCPDEIELSPEIIAELKQACQPQELPYAVGQVKDGIVVPFEFGRRCK